MSCHDIGRGMNSVVRTTITLFYEGKIPLEAARSIILSCKHGVHWCDGNEGEAVSYITGCICGKCMKKVKKGEKLYNIYSVSNDVPDRYDWPRDFVTHRLCEECFDIVLNEKSGDNAAGPRERAYIEKTEDPADYTSTGEYENHNNGFKWVT